MPVRTLRRWAVMVVTACLWPAHALAVPQVDALAQGAKLFLVECAGCHGPQGDGNGVADPEMQPRPRDLTSGRFKLRTTWSRSPATRAEIYTTITNGIPGTAMPSFRFLSEDDRRHLAAYVASIGKLPAEEKADPVAVPPEPPFTPALVAEGKKLYDELGCPACHGAEGKGDGAAAPYLKDEWASKTPPRDLTREPYKGGESPRDIYLRFAIGMPGTGMPSYADAVKPEQLWALVAYMRSLRPKAAPPPPKDPVEWGRALVAEEHCLACHGLTPPAAKDADPQPAPKGGKVGPSLDVAARLLDPSWLREFLVHPRAYGKLYPAFPYRMPDLGLTPPEASAVAAYLDSVAGRPTGAKRAPTPKVTTADVLRGRALYAVSCAACHHLDAGAPTAPLDDQGPDLAFAASRYDFDSLVQYVTDPRKLDPDAKMAPPRLDASDVRAIAAFVWSAGKAKAEADEQKGKRGTKP